jgi:hypothetical protein
VSSGDETIMLPVSVLCGRTPSLNGLQVLAVVERDERPPASYLRQPVRDDLEFHDRVVRRAMQLGSLEKPNVVGSALVPHEDVDVPGRRRRAPRQVLRRHGDVETLARIEQQATTLKSGGRLEEGSFGEAERGDGLRARAGDATLGLKVHEVGRQ